MCDALTSARVLISTRSLHIFKRAKRVHSRIATARLSTCASSGKVIVHNAGDAFELRQTTVALDVVGEEPRRDTFELAMIEYSLLGGRAV